jgi:hypothetical protein
MAHRFLVATTHHLLAIDPQSRRVWRIHSGSGLYYGLAKDEAGLLYAACRHTVTGPDDETVRAGEVGSILVLDRGFRVVGETRPPFPMRDVHGTACFDGRLWVTCSFDNMLAIYDLATGEWSRWYPAPHPADRGRDVHHFNTVRKIGNEICLVAHHFGPSELLFYDSVTRQLNSAVSMGAESHDVFLFEDALATCSSSDGWCINASGKRLRTGNFPRGVATTPEGHLLGISLCCDRGQRASQNGILRWYTPDWRFRADYVLPRVGMVLDIMEVEEQEYGWQALENWPDVEVTSGEYNRVAPGNHYTPAAFAACAGSHALEWHAAEDTHCWMAARQATLSILVNPGETRLSVEIGSSNPCPYFAEIRLDETLLGTARFPTPGVQRYDFRIPEGSGGSSLLSFRVPHLWQPSQAIAGNQDQRSLGLAVYGVTVGL